MLITFLRTCPDVHDTATTSSRSLLHQETGTDTEYLYFSELKDYVLSHFPDRYSAIKVVPVPEEIIKEKNPKRSAQVRKLNNVPQYHYYCKYESTADAYALYRAQPTRYVREAALFMQEDGYAEGWAVFDNDKHPAHEAAFQYASQDHVGIAFSSYSFEEWLLAHFERCPKAFQHSECKEGDKELHCGSIDAVADGDCHGENCIGGRLRSQGYIPDYSKNGKGVFGKVGKICLVRMVSDEARNAEGLRVCRFVFSARSLRGRIHRRENTARVLVQRCSRRRA